MFSSASKKSFPNCCRFSNRPMRPDSPKQASSMYSISSQTNSSQILDMSMASSSRSGVSQAAMEEIASFEKFIKEYFDKAARP